MMKYKYHKVAGLLLTSLTVAACGGGGGSSINDVRTSDVSLRFSDAPVENADKVVITVDKIIFSRNSGDITIDRFTSSEMNLDNADTFQLDLLEVQGNDSRLVLDLVKLPIGSYTNFRIEVLDEDVNHSYVQESDSGLLKPIKVPSDELKLGSFEVSDQSSQTFVVEFGLRQSLTYNPGPDRYILKPTGVRVVSLENAATLSGVADLAAIHQNAPCSTKPDSTVGNVAYLYSGHNLNTSNLGDVLVRPEDAGDGEESDPNVPANIIAPAVATNVDAEGNFLFSFLNSGQYTLAFSCQASDDNPVLFDGIRIPAPSSASAEVTLGAGETHNCTVNSNINCAIAP